jgi:hypothetical protein
MKPSSPEQIHREAELVAEGSALTIAFKTGPGQVILQAFSARAQTDIEIIIFDAKTEEEILAAVNRLRAFIMLSSDMGDSIKRAARAIASKALQTKLTVGMQEKGTHEDDSIQRG